MRSAVSDSQVIRVATPRLSERIGCVRVLAILGMVYVHVPGVGTLSSDGTVAGFGVGFLIEGVGRASSALLAVVSGWLVAAGLISGRSSAPRLILRRANTTLVPMVFWASVTVLMYCLVALARPTFLNVPYEGFLPLVKRFLDTVFFLTSDPAGPTMHLSFLRDLFVCVLLSSVLLSALRRVPAFTLVVLGLVYVLQLQLYVVLRPLVLFGFAIGMSLALSRARLDALDRWSQAWLLMGCVATVAIMLIKSRPGPVPMWTPPVTGMHVDPLETVLYPLARLCWAMALWGATRRLADHAFAPALNRAAPLIFITFCTHFLSLTVVWFLCVAPVLNRLPEPLASASLFGWFIVAPFVALLIAWVLIVVMKAVSPTLGRLAGLSRRSAVRTLPPPAVRA